MYGEIAVFDFGTPLKVKNCTGLQKQLNPLHGSVEPGHKLRAYVSRLYKETTPSVFKEDQVVKAGRFLDPPGEL